VNALCTSFRLRPRRIARSWAARASACIVALALILAGALALAMPGASRADSAASPHSAHCAGHAPAHAPDAHRRDAEHSCCTNACSCVHACMPVPIADGAMRVPFTGEAFRACVARAHASVEAPLLRPPIA
jgi:hypothetical protein